MKLRNLLQSKEDKYIYTLYNFNKERSEQELDHQSKKVEKIAIKLQDISQRKQELSSVLQEENDIFLKKDKNAGAISQKKFIRTIKECIEKNPSNTLKKQDSRLLYGLQFVSSRKPS